MASPKHRLERIHGGAESTELADPSVIARRKYHEAAAVWCGKSLVPMQVLFALIGASVILLPAISQDYRIVIEHARWLSWVFHDYSTFSGVALVNLFLGLATALTKPYWSKSTPSGKIASHNGRPAPVACPMTIREEISFWVEIFSLILVTTVWLFLPFGVISYFLTIGG